MRIETSAASVRPDISFPRQRIAVFVDGCFWHCCPVHGTEPRSNREYWLPKLARNRTRDELVNRALVESGWEVIRVWEHESAEVAVTRLAAAVARHRAMERERSVATRVTRHRG
jgi:DNA mismatch endonuclease, patch repair protein